MLPEQCVAGVVYDKRLQISRGEVCETSVCTSNHFRFMNAQLVYPSTLTLFRHFHENPGSVFIDRDLDTLFKDLKTKTASPQEIIRKLRIDRGQNKQQ